jgi:hypothetical protein
MDSLSLLLLPSIFIGEKKDSIDHPLASIELIDLHCCVFRILNLLIKTNSVDRHLFPYRSLTSSLSYQLSMAQRLPFCVIILLFTILVAVSSRPSYQSKATQVKKDTLIALKQFDLKKASHERRIDQFAEGVEGNGPWRSPISPLKPQPSHHHHHHHNEQQGPPK